MFEVRDVVVDFPVLFYPLRNVVYHRQTVSVGLFVSVVEQQD